MDSLLKRLGAVAVAIVLLASCSKKEEAPPPVAGPEPAAASPAAPIAPSAGANQGQVNTASTANPSAALSEADAALKAREYERAVQAMLLVQQANLNEQQAAAARNQMTRLQNDLATAVARGDPRAKAAADLLRRSASGGR